MPPENRRHAEDRAQTDESLRLEREKVDHALEEQLAAIDETADAVISRARARADEVLAETRAHTDQQAVAAGGTMQSRTLIESEREVADETLRDERADADETLRQERAEHVGLLSIERRETDQDLLSERARSDDVLKTRDEFLGMVGHDLRNMLNAMVGSAVLIAREVVHDNHVDTVLVHANRISRASARMNRLIGDLVDVATIETGTLAVTREVADAVAIVIEAVDTFEAQAKANGIALTAEAAVPTSTVPFDAARILQVVTNLLSNAIKFTPPGGRVHATVHSTAEGLRFAVSDTGVGIPADKLDAVFGRFVQVKSNDRRGVGLGLYISKCIVQSHGGRIWAESTPGVGSTFYFTLPAA
jgi:signal transduction histidine kinase